jgi:hypothetical protein
MDELSQRERMREWIAVGLREGATFRELAHRSGLSERTLRRWNKKFRTEFASREEPDRDGRAFVELVERVDPDVPRIEVVLPEGRRVVLAGAAVLDVLVRAFSSRATC